jgi:hypothetical protein
MRTFTRILGCCVLALSGCPGDEEGMGGDTDGTDGSGSEGSGSTTTGTSTGGQSETSAASTASTTGTSAAESEGGSGGADESSGGGEGESTGAADPCEGLSREECNANRDCMVITCSPYEMSGDPGNTPWCIGEPEFLGCQTATGCDDMRTIACAGDDAPAFACPSSCIPVGWSECAPPVEGEVPMCM